MTELPSTRKVLTENVSPHTVKQILITGKDRPFVMTIVHRLHEFVIRGIPEEVIEGQKALLNEPYELTLYPADEWGLKKGKHLQKKRFATLEDAESYLESTAKSIESGDLR